MILLSAREIIKTVIFNIENHDVSKTSIRLLDQIETGSYMIPKLETYCRKIVDSSILDFDNLPSFLLHLVDHCSSTTTILKRVFVVNVEISPATFASMLNLAFRRSLPARTYIGDYFTPRNGLLHYQGETYSMLNVMCQCGKFIFSLTFSQNPHFKQLLDMPDENNLLPIDHLLASNVNPIFWSDFLPSRWNHRCHRCYSASLKARIFTFMLCNNRSTHLPPELAFIIFENL